MAWCLCRQTAQPLCAQHKFLLFLYIEPNITYTEGDTTNISDHEAHICAVSFWASAAVYNQWNIPLECATGQQEPWHTAEFMSDHIVLNMHHLDFYRCLKICLNIPFFLLFFVPFVKGVHMENRDCIIKASIWMLKLI